MRERPTGSLVNVVSESGPSPSLRAFWSVMPFSEALVRRRKATSGGRLTASRFAPAYCGIASTDLPISGRISTITSYGATEIGAGKRNMSFSTRFARGWSKIPEDHPFTYSSLEARQKVSSQIFWDG